MIGSGEAKTLYVCRGHYIQLVSRRKVADFVKYSLGFCQMVGCGKNAYRRVLINGEISGFVSVSEDGELVEEVS